MGDLEKNKELHALLKLLDEPDPEVFEKIRDRIQSFGPEAIPLLEDSWENIFNADLQRRIEDIIVSIQFEQLRFDLTNWVHFSSQDLLKGFLLVSRYQYPELSEHEVLQKVEQLKWDIWLELNENLTPLEQIKVVNHVFFEIHKFAPNRINPNALQNYFLNNVLETFRGNPISLGILYLVLCNRLNLPVSGVDLPEHFILGYVREPRLGEAITHEESGTVQFYINPFKKGAVFTKREVELYLTQLKLDQKPEYYRPCDNIVIIRRLIVALQAAYRQHSLPEKVEELEMLLKLL
ncbi:MAG: transglutaminase-like domain-containing protein [Bacteroidota bacterium]